MAGVPAELERRIAQIASDRTSGASEILDEVISVLRHAIGSGAPMIVVAQAICRAQPSMAPVWNATFEALASPQRFERFAKRVARAPEQLTRFAVDFLSSDPGPAPLRLVTLSFSRSVARVLEALTHTHPLHVACSEGRPALEGRRLASRLAESGIPVTYFSDAALGHALASADAVVLGADTVAPEWFLNKSGTRMLAATADQQGLPVYVVATRDKFVSRAVAECILVTEGAPSELWESAPAGVTVRNPYFERTPLDLVASVITDVGVLGAGMVPDVCSESHDATTLRALEDLAR
jgi:translation initiation factor eIF-2B subunit delta/methylthioribose-1-phosphate isomerase